MFQEILGEKLNRVVTEMFGTEQVHKALDVTKHYAHDRVPHLGLDRLAQDFVQAYENLGVKQEFIVTLVFGLIVLSKATKEQEVKPEVSSTQVLHFLKILQQEQGFWNSSELYSLIAFLSMPRR